MMLKNLIKRGLPPSVFSVYHFFLAALAAFVYSAPSERLKIIGVTGTSGKSSAIHFLRYLLEAAGEKTASLSTIDFYLAGQATLNNRKMTMLGRLATQRFLARAVRAGCTYAIIETTSEGVVQHRQRFINYDVAVLTNLYPEHLEAHGGFANYQAAKLKFFRQVAGSRRKNGAAKVAVVNGDNQYAGEFLAVGPFDKKLSFGQGASSPFGLKPKGLDALNDLVITDLVSGPDGLRFKINTVEFFLPILGEFNALNFAAAAAVMISQDFKLADLVQTAAKMPPVPGHLEFIKAGQPFKILVDYAFEPVAMRGLYQVVASIKPGRVIHVLGSAGGGRDALRRPVLGGLAGESAALVIVTNEDPYDEDPRTIIDQVARGALAAGKKLDVDLFKILDRRQAIARALALARPQDLVLITGKGAEQAICVAGGKKIPWDDRMVVKSELSKLMNR